MTIRSYDTAGQDYIFRALTTARSSGFGTPPFGTLGPNPALVSTAAAARVTTAGITCNAPATITAGNLLVAISLHTTSSATFTPPAGWTQVERLSASSAVATVFTKVATGSEPASYTFTASASAAQHLYILNYSNAGAVFFTEFNSPAEPITLQSNVLPNSRMFYLGFDGTNNASSVTVTSSPFTLTTVGASASSTDPMHILRTSDTLYDVTEPTSVDVFFSVAGTSAGSLVAGCVIPKEQITYFDVASVTAAVTTSDWQTTTRIVSAGNPNTTLYVDSGDIQLSKDNTNWNNYVSASIGDTVYIRSRVVDSNNLVAGIQTLNVYCLNDQVAFQYILNANISMTTTNLSSNTALSYTYEPAGRVVALVGTDTITASGTGQVRKNSTGTWGTSVAVVSGDTLNYRIVSSATRDVATTTTISSTRSGAALFTVSAVTTSEFNFGTSTSFTIPLGVSSIGIACIGAGGGGAGGQATGGGGGGGGGAVSYINSVSVSGGQVATITVGTGGAGGTGSGVGGNAGGTTSVTYASTIRCSAGGGVGGASGGGGGAGGSTGTGTASFAGGAGGAGGDGVTTGGGGGGSAAKNNATGSAGGTRASVLGGDFGPGTVAQSGSWTLGTSAASSSTGAGSTGAVRGGGGGGGVNSGTGGAGQVGGVTIICNGRTFSSASTY